MPTTIIKNGEVHPPQPMLCFNVFLHAKIIMLKSVLPVNCTICSVANLSNLWGIVNTTSSGAAFAVWSTCLHRHRWYGVTTSNEPAVDIKYWHSRSIHTIAPNSGVWAVALALRAKSLRSFEVQCLSNLFWKPLHHSLAWQCQQWISSCSNRSEIGISAHNAIWTKPRWYLMLQHQRSMKQTVDVVYKVFFLNSWQVCSFNKLESQHANSTFSTCCILNLTTILSQASYQVQHIVGDHDWSSGLPVQTSGSGFHPHKLFWTDWKNSYNAH